MPRCLRSAAGAGIAAAILGLAGAARADPQWNVSLTTGVCGVGEGGSYWDDTCWHNGLRGDVMFLRERNSDFGLGPYLDFTTAGFDDVKLGGGGSLHIPVHPFVPIVLSGGGYARHSKPFGWEPGIAGWLFIGSRSYNFHSSYIIASGLLVGLQRGFGDSDETAVIIAIQLDAVLASLPFVIGYEAIKGPPEH